MTITSLDGIVRTVLLQRGYSLHWYLQCLVYARDCLRELTFDDLQVYNSKLLPVTTDGTNEVQLPADYKDFIKVGVMYGQMIRPLVQYDKMNPLPNYDSSFQEIPYLAPQDAQNPPILYGFIAPYFWRMSTINEFGEMTGRFYGLGAGIEIDTFKIFPERNIIKLNENLTCTQVVLIYISDGMSIDAASSIDNYAQAAIEAYIKWQLKENNRSYSDGERMVAKMEYIQQRKILRARKNNLTISDMKRILHRANYLAPKN